MEKDYFDLENRNCMAYYQDHPKILLIQPVDEHDLKILDRQAELIVSGVKIPFLLAAFRVSDWNRELSPWPAPAVFGKNDFGDGAPETLRFIESRLLPFLLDRFGLSAEMPLIPGGYSLAGLFALWSVFRSDRFKAAAAASPSVWFRGWLDYAVSHQPHADYVYLSLGDKEEKTKNPQMAAVGSCIRSQLELLQAQGIPCELEWNEGNHFRDPEIRMAKGFIKCIKAVLPETS